MMIKLKLLFIDLSLNAGNNSLLTKYVKPVSIIFIISVEFQNFCQRNAFSSCFCDLKTRLLYGLPKYQICKLQRAQNTAVFPRISVISDHCAHLIKGQVKTYLVMRIGLLMKSSKHSSFASNKHNISSLSLFHISSVLVICPS